MKWLMTNNFSPRALTNFGVRGEKLLGTGGGVAVKDSVMRSRDDLRRQARILFPWPTTPYAASLDEFMVVAASARDEALEM